jgi:ribonuclease HI
VKGIAAAFCRSSSGVYLGSSAVVFDGITDPASLEALACREGFALAADLALSRIQIASDCKLVVEDIREGSMGRYGQIVKEFKHSSNQFDLCNVVHENRASIFEAHNLTKFVITRGVGRYIWLGIPYSMHIPVNIVINQ